jgi:nucleotide-binding universal stress UspA family protein
VVVGVDGSRNAEPALDQAVDEARRRAVPLEIVHGLPWGRRRGGEQDAAPSPDEARALVESAAARATARDPELTVLAAPVAEDAAAALVRRSRNAVLTVVGTRGHGGFAGLLLGSVSLRVAAHTLGPLLVVRGDLPPEHNRVPHDTVLLGVEGEADRDAAVFAFEEAALRRAKVTALHAWSYRHFTPPGDPLLPTGPARVDIARLARFEAAVPERFLAGFRDQYPQVRTHVMTVRARAARALVDASAAADLVVTAAHRRSGPLPLRLGPVNHALLHHAHCPVALVPDRYDGTDDSGEGGPGTP